MLDVFVTVGREVVNPIRRALAIATFARWQEEAVAGRARVIAQDWGAGRTFRRETERAMAAPADWCTLPGKGSQRLRHVHAAELATTDPYVLTDSDILPMRRRWVVDNRKPSLSWDLYVTRLMAERPRLAMLSALPIPGMTGPPESCPDAHVWRVAGSGGLRVVRRGVVTDEIPRLDPEQDGGYDATLGNWLTREGWECGYAYRWAAVHAGFGESFVWR